MGKMTELVYQRRKKLQKTRNIQELINMSQQQEKLLPQETQVPDADQCKPSTLHEKGTKSRPKSSPRRLSPEECNYEMLLSILRRKDTQGFFVKPVDGDEVEFYYETIEEPMDFGTIRTKIDKGKYKSIQQFERDVMLVFDNAMIFNDADTVYYRKANAIKEVAQKLFHALKSDPDNFQEKFFGSNQGESGKRTKANARLRNSQTKEEETTAKCKRHQAGSTKSKGLPVQRRHTHYASKKGLSVTKNDPVWALPNLNCSKSLLQVSTRQGDYIRSLMSFTKGLGEVAQRAAMKRLRVIQQEDDQVRNLMNQPRQCPIPGTEVPFMHNVENQSSLLVQSSSGTRSMTYPMSMSSLNWRMNPPMGSQAGFTNLGQSGIWTGDQTLFRYRNGAGGEMHLPSGSNPLRQHFHSGDQVSTTPSSNYSRFDGRIRGGQGSLSNSNYLGHSFHGGSPLNLRNSLVLRPELHWGNQTDLPSSNFLSLNPHGLNFQNQILSAHHGIGNRMSFPTVNCSRTDGGLLNPLDPHFSLPVVRGEDQWDSPHSNLSRLIDQIGNQMSTSIPNIEPHYGVIEEQNKKPEDCYILEGLPRCPSREAPCSSSTMPQVMVGDGNMDPSIGNEAGNRGAISWMAYANTDRTSSLGFRMETGEVGPSCARSLKDMIIPPEIFDSPVILREPPSEPISWLQPLDSHPGQAALTLRLQGQGRSLDKPETEDQIRKRKGKSIMDY